jgi:hypothetical protein
MAELARWARRPGDAVRRGLRTYPRTSLTPVQRRVLRLLRRRGHAMWRWELQRELGFLPRKSTCAALVRRGLVRFTNQGLLRV